MTDTRTKTDPAAEHDPAVSQAYRETATERTPEHLDRAVLAAAAQAARPAYSRLRFWTRPAAWAAVIMLSVALILETGQPPDPESLPPAIEEAVIDALPETEGEVNAADADDRAAAGVAERKAEAPVRKSDFSANGLAPTEARELRAEDEAVSKRAEEPTRMRQSSDEQFESHEQFENVVAPASPAPQQAAERAAGPAIELDEASTACDSAARAEPETWLACIRELEDAGFFDAARDERNQLEEAFPDFATR